MSGEGGSHVKRCSGGHKCLRCCLASDLIIISCGCVAAGLVLWWLLGECWDR